MDWRVGWRLDMSGFIKVALSRLGFVAFLCVIAVRGYVKKDRGWRCTQDWLEYIGMEEILG